MYTATLKSKSFAGGNLQIVVEYAHGTDVFTEAYNVISEDDLNNRIEQRIDALNYLLNLNASLALGAWVKPVKQEPVLDPVQEALNEVYRAKNNLDLKLITQAEYEAVVLAYKTLANEENKP